MGFSCCLHKPNLLRKSYLVVVVPLRRWTSESASWIDFAFELVEGVIEGLIGVVGQLLPKTDYRWYVRHIEATWAKTWKDVHMKKILWWSAWSTYEEEFVDQLKTMSFVSEQAVKDMLWDGQFWKVHPSHALEPPEILKMVGRSKVNRVRKKDEARKKEGLWSRSRKRLRMTCRHCREPGHNKRKCSLLQRGAQILSDVSLSVPQSSQQFVFMPTPVFVPSFSHQTSQSSTEVAATEAAGLSKLKRKSKDKHVVAPSKGSATKNVTTSSITEQSVVASRALVDEDEVESEDETPLIRPRSISEAHTRLQVKKMHQKLTGSRKISFRGDESGASLPIDLPYSSRKLIGRANQL